jgi:hypothetical protein
MPLLNRANFMQPEALSPEDFQATNLHSTDQAILSMELEAKGRRRLVDAGASPMMPFPADADWQKKMRLREVEERTKFARGSMTRRPTDAFDQL